VFSKRISNHEEDLCKETNVGLRYRYFWTANATLQVYDSFGPHKGQDLKGENRYLSSIPRENALGKHGLGLNSRNTEHIIKENFMKQGN
jgi:hypothetical protein